MTYPKIVSVQIITEDGRLFSRMIGVASNYRELNLLRGKAESRFRGMRAQRSFPWEYRHSVEKLMIEELS